MSDIRLAIMSFPVFSTSTIYREVITLHGTDTAAAAAATVTSEVVDDVRPDDVTQQQVATVVMDREITAKNGAFLKCGI